MVAALTVAQLQTLVIAICAVLTVIVPIITSVIILVLRNFGRIESVVGELRGRVETADGQMETLRSLADKIANPPSKDV